MTSSLCNSCVVQGHGLVARRLEDGLEAMQGIVPSGIEFGDLGIVSARVVQSVFVAWEFGLDATKDHGNVALDELAA